MLGESLQALLNNGLGLTVHDSIIRDLGRNNNFEDESERRWFVAYKFFREQVQDINPGECVALGYKSNGVGTHFECCGEEYLIVDINEADELCLDYILETLWAFSSKYLAGITGLNKAIFDALQPQCEGANEAVLALIKSTCGFEYFVDDVIKTDGRGHLLALYDGDERVFEFDNAIYYIYRVN